MLDEQAADAYALPGPPGRIVVTTGMLATLDESGQAALLAHERAHLAARHFCSPPPCSARSSRPALSSGACGGGPMPRRVAALLAPPPPRCLPLIAAALTITLLAALCALVAANDLQDLLSMANLHHRH